MTTSPIRPALVLLALLTLLTGIVYPLFVTGVAQAAFSLRAGGSVITRDGVPVASAMIGQAFSEPRYFWSRPSATGTYPYNAVASGGSNQGPLNPALVDAVKARIAALRAADPDNTAPIPVDLVTASGSGLDPHISVAAAEYQLARVARARHLPPSAVEAVLRKYAKARVLGILGEPRVNVVELNLALDETTMAR